MLDVFDLLLAEYPLYGGLSLFMFGAVMGSFVHCMGYRVAHGIGLRYPPSQCASCGQTLQAIDLIPVFSYLIFRGRCRRCHASVSFLYVGVEVLAGAVLPLLYYTTHSLPLSAACVAFWWLLLFGFSFLLHKKSAIVQD